MSSRLRREEIVTLGVLAERGQNHCEIARLLGVAEGAARGRGLSGTRSTFSPNSNANTRNPPARPGRPGLAGCGASSRSIRCSASAAAPR